MMDYSILMSVYAKENPEYLKQSIDSMLNQTVRSNDFVIVCDGPLTKELYGIIDFYASDPRNHIHKIQIESNVGLGAALNKGVKECINELVARMDSDDISAPKRCEQQLKEFEDDLDLDIVGSSVAEFSGDIHNILSRRIVPQNNEDIYQFAKIRSPFNHPAVMFKKKTILSVGGYRNYKKNQDLDLWLRLLSNTAKCKNIQEDLLYFRFDENTYKKRKSWITVKSIIQIRYRAWQNNICSFFDFIKVSISQIGILIVPIWIQKIIYKRILR